MRYIVSIVAGVATLGEEIGGLARHVRSLRHVKALWGVICLALRR